jgi:hypothetical protein
MFGIGLPFLFVWFAEGRIYFDSVSKNLYSEGKVFFRWRGRSILLTDCHDLHIYYTRVFTLGNWNLSMIQHDGSFKFLAAIPYLKRDKNWLDSFRETLEKNTGLPVVLHERDSSWRQQ